MHSEITTVILAAGQGQRMKSALPKVLHRIGDRTLLRFVIDAAANIDTGKILVVHGHGGEQIRAAFADPIPAPSHASGAPLAPGWVHQPTQLGTGHAVRQAMPHVPDDATVLVLYGDVPLIKPATLRAVVSQVGARRIGLVTVRLPDPAGYGRILRDSKGRVSGIVEEKDASDAERAITEVNTGIMAVPVARLRGWLARLDQDNAQGEFYLTDVIGFAVREGVTVETVMPEYPEEVLGVNDRIQLAELERHHQREQARALMASGVTLRDPARIDVRGEVTAGQDVTIDVNVILEGRVVIGDNVTIGPNTLIRDTEIGEGTEILANCVLEEAVVGKECRIGPFSRLRPQAELADRVHIGNFVEIKKSRVGEGSKVNHLTYIGDARIGQGVNVGAGTVTCNYDGVNKHRTEIEDSVFIGSGTMLVAPVTIGAGGTIGAGSTITKDTLPDKLTVERSRQVTLKIRKR